MTLARRIIESSLWATAANAAAVCVILVRSIVLARLLPVEVFGVYAFAATVVGLTAVAARFGLDGALLHRSDETRDESRAAAVHFTLTASFSILWAAGLIAGASVFSEGDFLLALLVLTGSQIGTHLASTPRTLLQRRVTHRPLAWLRISGAVISTGIALGLARAGHGLWALLMIDATAAALSLIVLYLWRPVWRPRLLWDARAVRYFLSFGARNLLGRLLEEALRRIDKLWIGVMMGQPALGLYSRSDAYSHAPVAFFSRPLSSIAPGVYAELKGNRLQLSRTVLRIAAVLFRSSCLFAAVVGLIAPELILFLIGDKWLPMVDSFRILLVAFVFESVGRTFSELLLAVGLPGLLVRIRFVQLAVLSAGILLFGQFGLTGIAASVLGSSLVGLLASLRAARAIVDFSHLRLFLPPLLAAALALLTGLMLQRLVLVDLSTWAAVAIRALASALVYVVVLLLLEGRKLTENFRLVLRHMRHDAPGVSQENIGS